MNIKKLNKQLSTILNEDIEKDIMGSYNLIIPNTNTGVSIMCTENDGIKYSTVSISSFSKGNLMHTFKTTDSISKQEADKRGQELASLIEPHINEIGKVYQQFLEKYNYTEV